MESVGIKKKEGIKTSSAEPDEPVGIIHHVETKREERSPEASQGEINPSVWKLNPFTSFIPKL